MLHYMIHVKLFLRPQLLRYREQTVLVLRVRNSTLSSASAPTLQGTDCSCTTCSKLNYFFGLSSYITGNGLLIVLCVRNSTVSLASAPTLQGTDCCLYYAFRNSTVSSTSLHIEPPVKRGTLCTEIRSGCTVHFRDE